MNKNIPNKKKYIKIVIKKSCIIQIEFLKIEFHVQVKL